MPALIFTDEHATIDGAPLAGEELRLRTTRIPSFLPDFGVARARATADAELFHLRLIDPDLVRLLGSMRAIDEALILGTSADTHS